MRAKLALLLVLLPFFHIGPGQSAPALQLESRQNEVDAELTTVAVHVVDNPKQSWKGGGVYLGNGFILTAAHVVGSSWFTKPTVEVAGLSLSAQIVREGSFADDDLTLLKVDETMLPMRLQLRHVMLCHEMPPPGSAVIVATPEGIARSKLFTPAAITQRVRAMFPTLIPDVASTGNSGSGVFEADGPRCLLGIMSRKISTISYDIKDGTRTKTLHDIAKYFVPSSVIARALPSWVRF